MRNKFTSAISIILLSAVLLACKFNLGDNTVSDSGSTNAANSSTTTSATTSKKSNAAKNESHETGDDLETSEETADAESNDSQEFRLEIVRSFYSLEKPEGPPQHGDYSYFKKLESGGTAGSLYLSKPREAVFIVWDGEVIAGPLTTVEQVEEAFESLSKQSAAEHEMRMDIMRNFPTVRKGRYRIYDSKGNLIREDDEP